jgi:hypothetical protein
MAPKSAFLPQRLIVLNEGVLGSAHEPSAINYQKTARHVFHDDVSPSCNLSMVLS